MTKGALELTVSELFVSVQGEGPSTGKPAVFVRLGRCNLACSYCDTPYTWDFERFDEQVELRRLPQSEVAEFVLRAGPGRLILTGGEPLIQQRALAGLIASVDQHAAELDPPPWAGRLVVEVETNGTILPTPALADRVDQWNVSPKLEKSGEPSSRRVREAALAWFSAQPRAFFKFVVGDSRDADEAAALIERFAVPRDRSLFMPLAKNRAELEAAEPLVAQLSRQAGVGLTTRLHLKLWDGARGT